MFNPGAKWPSSGLGGGLWDARNVLCLIWEDLGATYKGMVGSWNSIRMCMQKLHTLWDVHYLSVKKEEMDRSSSTLKSQNAESVQRQIIIHLPPLLPKRIRNKNKAFSTSIKWISPGKLKSGYAAATCTPIWEIQIAFTTKTTSKYVVEAWVFSYFK